MTRIGIVTQARTSSTRLPGKVLLRLGDRSVLDHHLDRLARTGLPVVVATTTNAGDDAGVAVAKRHGVPSTRGSEQHVLSRFVEAAGAHGLDAVVRVTSDCPLIDPELIVAGVDRFVHAGDPWTYVSNGLRRTYPRGFDFEVFSTIALTDARQRATLPEDIEHVTPYLHRNRSGLMTLVNVQAPADHSGHRVTLDTAEDLELLRRLVEDHDAAGMSWSQIVRVLDRHPELVAVNAHVEHKELGE